MAIRNIRRDANASLKDLVKEKMISEDEQRKAEGRVQKLTDAHIALVDEHLQQKEAGLLAL